MPLAIRSGSLLRRGLSLLTGCCCITPPPPPPPPPCDPPCGECEECINFICLRIPDCCADGTPCGECEQCVGGRCEPCGPCEKCVDGACVPCEECETCTDGTCVPCPDGTCVDGECPCPPGFCEVGTAANGTPLCCPCGWSLVNGICCPAFAAPLCKKCPQEPCPPGLCCEAGFCVECQCDPPCSTCERCEDGVCVEIPECCNPPCDEDNCEECVGGECVSTCEEGENCCDGECQAEPCCPETECRSYVYESSLDDETGWFFEGNIGTCSKSEELKESLGVIDGVPTWRYTTRVTITCECRDSFEAATGPVRGADSTNPGDPIPYEVVPCEIWCCEADEDNNPTGNCFLSEAEGQDCVQGVQYASEAACLEGCNPPP